ncbi:MAG: hypothetical protein WBA10_02995 [Elainellaceae cyanobacterium]
MPRPSGSALRLRRCGHHPLRQNAHHVVGVLSSHYLSGVEHLHRVGPVIGFCVAEPVQLMAAVVDGVEGADDDVQQGIWVA